MRYFLLYNEDGSLAGGTTSEAIARNSGFSVVEVTEREYRGAIRIK
jgi:hypothetical protein